MNDVTQLTPEQQEAQTALNAQIAFTVDRMAEAAKELELDGIHQSAIISGTLAMFVQLMCAASILGGRTLEEVKTGIVESIDFTRLYAEEVFGQMKAEQEAKGVANAQ